MTGAEPRQTTSHIGHISKPSHVALVHGLNKYYYSIAINYRKSESEQKMLLNLHKSGWTQSLKTQDFSQQHTSNLDLLKTMQKLTADYSKWIEEESKKTTDEFKVASVGKMNPKTHLAMAVEESLTNNVMNCLGTMLSTVVF